MWIYNEDGFFSTIEPVETDGSWLCVRARVEADLHRMVERLQTQQEFRRIKFDVIDNSLDLERDYPYRMTVDRDAWVSYLVMTANALDYDNFKHRVAKKIGDTNRNFAMLQVWQIQWGNNQDMP